MSDEKQQIYRIKKRWLVEEKQQKAEIVIQKNGILRVKPLKGKKRKR